MGRTVVRIWEYACALVMAPEYIIYSKKVNSKTDSKNARFNFSSAVKGLLRSFRVHAYYIQYYLYTVL